jgi:signal transduction histidine kinase
VADEAEGLRREIEYYRRQIDELGGETVKLDYAVSGLRHQLNQKRQAFTVLSELEHSVAAQPEISAILDRAIRAINATLEMDRTVVLVPAEAENHYRPGQWLGFPEEESRKLSSLVFCFPPEFAAGTGVLVVNKATAPTKLINEIRIALDLPFFVCLPVTAGDSALGLLLAGRLKEARPLYPPFDQGDVETFQAIASLVASYVRALRIGVLEQADRLKTEFFANVSHEFRTPITLTLGPLELILASRYGEIPAAVCQQIEIALRNQEQLLGLVNQILDLAKFEAGGMELKASPMADMNRFIEERVGRFGSGAQERGLELRLVLDPRVPGAEIFIDRDKFGKLLFNLLSNAFKFTREGHVEVATSIHGDSFRLTVSDSGIGIRPDQLPYIFDRFRQADGSESREFAGTGIGLALVKEIAALHGGDARVFSQYGSGSTFEVTVSAWQEPSERGQLAWDWRRRSCGRRGTGQDHRARHGAPPPRPCWRTCAHSRAARHPLCRGQP